MYCTHIYIENEWSVFEEKILPKELKKVNAHLKQNNYKLYYQPVQHKVIFYQSPSLLLLKGLIRGEQKIYL